MVICPTEVHAAVCYYSRCIEPAACLKRGSGDPLGALLRGIVYIFAALVFLPDLETPDVINQATSDYRGEMDLLAGLIEDRCGTGRQYEARAKYLYQEFTQWCDENSENPWTQRTVGLRLGDR